MKHNILTTTLIFTLAFVCLSMTSVFQTGLDDDWVVPQEYQTMKNPYANSKDTENLGKTLFLKHCKLCHGQTGKGDGKMAKLLDIEVGNFTTEAFKAQTDGAMYYKFLNGRNEMPEFKNKISNKEHQWLIINYIKTLK